MADPIEKVFKAEGNMLSEVIARVMADTRAPGSVRTPRDIAELMHQTTLIAWSDGLELGLALAIEDIAPARRLLEWIRREILERDSDARSATDDSVAAFLKVLDR